MPNCNQAGIDFQGPRHQNVISVEKDQVFSGGERSAMVPRRDGSDILGEHGQLDGVAKGSQDVRRAIARAVVDNDNFFIRKLLAQGRFDGLPDKSFLIVTSNHYAKLHA